MRDLKELMQYQDQLPRFGRRRRRRNAPQFGGHFAERLPRDPIVTHSPMPNTRWRPMNINRPGSNSTLDPYAFTHAKRFPSFDDVSDDGSSVGSRKQRLPRTDASKLGKKLPRSSLSSGSGGKLPRSNPETMSEILERLPRANLVPRITDSPWAADDTSLLLNTRDVNRGLPRRASQPQTLENTGSPANRLPRSDGTPSNLDVITSSARKRLTRSDNSHDSGDSLPLSASHLLTPTNSVKSDGRARSLPRHVDPSLKASASASGKLPRTSLDDSFVPAGAHARSGRLPRSDASVVSASSMASLPAPKGNRLPRS